jgi:hypothetical protein
MSRNLLPNRRYAETFDINCLGSMYIVQVGYYPDGGVGEVFINSRRVGSQADINARDAAVLLSLAIQNGIQPADLLDSLMHDAEGNPEGVVGIIVAAVVKWIKEERANVEA